VNEALFRQVNEQIRSLSDQLGIQDGTITVICECGDADCTERLELHVSEYERIRGDSLHYVIVTGHALPDVERVVEQRDGWEVVCKVGIARDVAEETDPRS
jgi:glyceraldehyde-3-phosphate dehydrogenase/erythrose-4-phosphate dehydrogenase